MSLTIAQALDFARELDSDTARLDVALLLAHVLERDRSYLLTWPDVELSATQQENFLALLQRRQAGEPVAYLLGSRGFWSLQLQVSPATLIPRPETELLVEHALHLPLPSDSRVMDLGTGTGAIALALAVERPEWHVVATDLSAEAVALAKRNAQQHGVTNVSFRHGTWFDAMSEPQRFHLIVSNPPYIDPHDPHLTQGDVRFEPASALVAQDQGYADLAQIIAQAPEFMTDAAWILLEHGFQQGQRVREMLQQRGFVQVQTLRDLNGLERVSLGCWHEVLECMTQ